MKTTMNETSTRLSSSRRGVALPLPLRRSRVQGSSRRHQVKTFAKGKQRNIFEGQRPWVELIDGKPASGPDLSCTVDGVYFPNPFVIGSGPPGTNYHVMKKAFDEGWGGVIAKTVTLDSSKVINVTPRYARMKSNSNNKEVIGWENIELVSDRPFEKMMEEFKLKAES